MKKLKALLLLVLSLIVLQLAGADVKAKYVFLFIGDGMGENIRLYYQSQYPDSCLEKFPVIVKTGTNNCMDKVTDSAASGTAIACGIKTYNGAIGVNEKQQPVTSLAKIFRDRNYRVGVITSVGLNDATPGAHYANRLKRQDYAGILTDLFASNFDFFAGGWLLLPKDYKEKHYAHLLKQAKYEFRNELVFDEKAPYSRVVYVSSMEPDWPERPQVRHLLAETTAFAAEKLSRNNKGFFLVVEGGEIDHRAHGNDLAGTVREMREFDLAVKVALDFQKKHPDDTLIVVTTDHDTGGLNIDKVVKEPLWQAQGIGAGSIESEFKKLFNANASDEELIAFLCKRFGLGKLTGDENTQMKTALAAQRDPELRKSKSSQYRSMYGSYNPVVIQAMRIRDARCGISWTGFNHTDRKILTNASGAGAGYFKAVKENSDIASAISKAAFGEDVMPQARVTTPHLVPGKAEEYFNFITAGADSLTFRYGQHQPGELEFVLSESRNGGALTRTVKVADIELKNLKPGAEYTVLVKQGDNAVSEQKVVIPAFEKAPVSGKLEFAVTGNNNAQTVKRSDRAGRIEFKNLQPGKEYTMLVKRGGKVIAERKVTVPGRPQGELIARFGIVADPHVSLIPDARYGRIFSKSVPALESAFKDLQNSKVDFIALPGDISDASKVDEIAAVRQVVKKFPQMTFYGVPGNHDRLNSNKDFKKTWIKTFGETARLEKRGKLQILMLDTFDGLLSNKEANLKAIDALDVNLPVIVISHSQLIADDFMTDPDRAIHDADKAKDGKLKTPELAAAVAPRLEKLAKMQGFILIGHKNVATKQKLGNLMQINLPQLTQFPAGYCYAELYTDGMRLEFRPGLDEFFDEYSRLRCAVYGMDSKVRDSHSLTIWNAFYPMDCSKAK